MSGRIAIDLTEHQVHVLDLLSQGLTFAQIARKVGSTPSAVGTCLHRAYRKLGANSATHAVRIGFELGILSGSGALKTELSRVYRALAEANGQLAEQPVSGRVKAHAFGEYLLGLREVA